MPEEKESALLTISKYAGAALTIIAVASAVWAWDRSKASKEDVRLVEVRLEQKIVNDRVLSTEERIYKIEDRYGTDESKMPENVRENYRKLKSDLKKDEFINQELIKQLPSNKLPKTD